MLMWLYERDYADYSALLAECERYHGMGYRVFIQGYSAMDCKEYKPV
jgi:hypothetical protein